MNDEYVYVGIDVAKETLEVSEVKGCTAVANTPKGIRALFKKVQDSCQKPMLCCEPTGGYEKKLITMALELDIPIAMVNAKRVRDFAKSKGILAKTDAIDAKLIAQFACQNNPQPITTPDVSRKKLQELMMRRDGLIDHQRREKNRLDPEPDNPAIKKSIIRMLKQFQKEIGRIQESMDELLEENLELKTLSERLQAVKAIGPVTALSVLSMVPELGAVTSKQVTSLVGLAPFNQDSGMYRGQRFIKGGRKEARKALYMAALVGIRYNPIFKELYDRLKNKGKPSKVALTAVMRKILILMNRIAADPDFVPA